MISDWTTIWSYTIKYAIGIAIYTKGGVIKMKTVSSPSPCILEHVTTLMHAIFIYSSIVLKVTTAWEYIAESGV